MSPRKKSLPVDELALSVEPYTSISNLACERAVLGECLEDDRIQDAVFAAGLIDASDFSLSDFRRVYQAISDLREQNLPADIVSVCEKLGNQQNDYALCSDLVSGVVLDARHILHHCEIVRSKARLRRIHATAEWLGCEVDQPGTDPDGLVRAAVAKLAAL